MLVISVNGTESTDSHFMFSLLEPKYGMIIAMEHSKLCNSCQEIKSISSFNKAGRKTDGSIKYKGRCKLCTREADRIYQESIKGTEQHEKNLNRDKERAKNNPARIIAISYLQNNPCVICGEDNVMFLEFDHIKPGKTATISELIARYSSPEIVLNEISLCQVLCCNCHLDKTAKEQNWFVLEYLLKKQNPNYIYKNRGWAKSHISTKEMLFEIMMDSGCIDCGEKNPLYLEFDHIENKTLGVARMVARHAPKDRILDEVNKCVVRCRKCHKLITAERANFHKLKLIA